MTSRTEFWEALGRYREVNTPSVHEMAATVAAFGTEEQAAEATAMLAAIQRVERGDIDLPTRYVERINTAIERIRAFTAQHTTTEHGTGA